MQQWIWGADTEHNICSYFIGRSVVPCCQHSLCRANPVNISEFNPPKESHSRLKSNFPVIYRQPSQPTANIAAEWMVGDGDDVDGSSAVLTVLTAGSSPLLHKCIMHVPFPYLMPSLGVAAAGTTRPAHSPQHQRTSKQPSSRRVGELTGYTSCRFVGMQA